MEKIKFNLDLILPDIPDERDACVSRITAILGKHKGIEKVHLITGGAENKPQLCFHYDPDIISLDQIQNIARQEGAAMSHKYGHLLIEVKAFRELEEAEVLEQQIKAISGVIEVSVSASGNIRTEYDNELTSEEMIKDVITQNDIDVIYARHPHEEREEAVTEEAAHEHAGAIKENKWKQYSGVVISLTMLLSGIGAEYFFNPAFFSGWVRLLWYAIAYLPVGYPVTAKGVRLLFKGDIFTEFALMSIATIGAFCIGEYPEGVAVMLFYTVGELFQDAAVNKAKRSIKALLDIRPESASVKRGGSYVSVSPRDVKVGEIIQIKAGEKVPLDGEILNEGSSFNTAALTGESRPSELVKGQTALAGMINQDKVVELKVTQLFNNSSLARILSLVQEATTRKAKTEQFIRKFSRIYTPIVVFLALGIATAPYFFVHDYVFKEWLYRALIFLVISCPCALVISIPLGYFGGIGAASRNGILFKGSNFLDLITKVNVVVMDKTGTLTKGVFKVQEVRSFGYDEKEWLPMAAVLEAQSTHPIAQAVVAYVGDKTTRVQVANMEEISGHGIKGVISGKEVLAGNLKLMDKMGVPVEASLKNIVDTIVVVAVDKKLVGYITIADEIKNDSKQAIQDIHNKRIETVMLSGDKQAVVDKVARELSIDKAYGDLLPENKVGKVVEIKKDQTKIIAFVGDGINDAPVLALSDIGIAMGGLGSDAAIETADVIIQTDQPSKIAKAIDIGKATNRVVWQNIIFAFVVKGIVMVLGAGGVATMWEAVFADVGVALLAVLNAMRIQKMKF